MKIICVGRNYADHIGELKNERPSEPVLFMKPDSALIIKNKPFVLPSFSNEVHHEAELVVRICKAGKYIEPRFAHRYYDAVTVGVDFTARDVQEILKGKGLPWEISKAFDGSAPIGDFISAEIVGDLNNLDFRLEKNGITVQNGNTALMLFKVDEIIAFASQFFTLKIGDLIFTGTPAGVGSVCIGDRLSAWLKDMKVLDFEVI